MEIAIICAVIFVIWFFVSISQNKKPNQKTDIDVTTRDNNDWGNIWEDNPKDKAVGDMIYSNVQKLQSLNNQLETVKEPVILENIKSEMEVWINACITLEETCPNTTCKLKASHEKLQRIKERYNERLYLIVKKSLEEYKLKMSGALSNTDRDWDWDWETESIFEQIQYYEGFIEKTAKNYKDCLDAFTEFHNEVEDLYSGLIYNDLDLTKAFSIILEKESFKNHIVDVIKLICNNKLDKENLDSLLKEYYTDVKNIKLYLIDLIIY
jgi:hypothetical protein